MRAHYYDHYDYHLMRFALAVKEKLARVIGEYFTTNQIVNVFTDANIPTDIKLYAKWRITLDAFSKMSEPDEAIPHILEVFCHPLNFQDPQVRKDFVEKLNAVLTYDKLQMHITDRGAQMLDEHGFPDEGTPPAPQTPKTSMDYVVEAITFFKDEYNKVRMSGLQYEYPIGENYKSEQTDQDSDVYNARIKAIERLKNAGFITEYTIEERVENEGYYIWDYAICKIDESKLTQKDEPRATAAAADAIAQKVVHEHTHRFASDDNSSPFKMEITKVPELQVRNVEDTSIPKGKKRLHLPKFKPTDWAKITLRFIGEQNVLITADKKQVPSDYEALGFADDKRGKPNTAWAFLIGLAQNNGETKTLPTPIPDTIKQHKRQLADRLKTIFKNDTDPFYEPTDSRTYKIKLTLIPPHTESDLQREEYLTD